MLRTFLSEGPASILAFLIGLFVPESNVCESGPGMDPNGCPSGTGIDPKG